MKRWGMGKALAGVVLAVALVGSMPSSDGATRAPVPSPAVSRLVGPGVKGYPFNALPFDPASVGYVEEELVVAGLARAYDLSPVALRAVGAGAPALQAPYRTRMIVRRPTQAAAFNGTVIVEWLNVTSGYDVEGSFAELRRELFRSGYAYVGVTAQLVGAVGLRLFDALRYAGVVHPGDAFSYDMFSQAIQALRRPTGIKPLGALKPARVIATGASQSGSALNNYLNLVAPKVERVVDGFLVLTSAAALAPPEVPVVRVLTEGEAGAGNPDGPKLREWEIASATHVDKFGGDWFARTQYRDFFPGWPLTPNDTPGVGGPCLMGRFPKFYAMHAALDALNRWVAGGPPAPTAPRIKLTADGELARDGNDNTVGGIRLPAAEAPTATYYGDQKECGPTLGRTIPFTPAKLKRLYPTRATYVDKVTAAAGQAVSAGFLLPIDADLIIAEAQNP
jgi:hypothetical protein